MARNVVATMHAMEGIEAGAGCHIAKDAEGFAGLVLQHLDSGPNPDGRDAILSSYNWEKNLSAIDRFLENPSEGRNA